VRVEIRLLNFCISKLLLPFQLILRPFQVTASDVLSSGIEIGISNGKISCLGTSLPRDENTQVIDAKGGYVTPGGVDSHVHFAQDNSPTGDNWLTGSRSAIAGGTTTVLAFASQLKTEESVLPCVAEYHTRAKGQSYCELNATLHHQDFNGDKMQYHQNTSN